eukprot:352911-Chlamydomonas_euryale.AAC.4
MQAAHARMGSHAHADKWRARMCAHVHPGEGRARIDAHAHAALALAVSARGQTSAPTGDGQQHRQQLRDGNCMS